MNSIWSTRSWSRLDIFAFGAQIDACGTNMCTYFRRIDLTAEQPGVDACFRGIKQLFSATRRDHAHP